MSDAAKTVSLIYFIVSSLFTVQAQENNTPISYAENLIVVTTDGLRWQEVFQGADSALVQDIKPPKAQKQRLERFSNPNSYQRRRLLMPFLWTTFLKQGRIYGNRQYGNHANVTNNRHISYPGYSEMLCGYADDKHLITNAKKWNPNINVLEWINQQPGYEQAVAAVGSWELFPYILNEKRAGITVNGGFEAFAQPLTEAQQALNLALEKTERPWKNHIRPDSLTWAFAKNILEEQSPKVLFIGYGETDEYAHENDYAGYLNAAARFDTLLQELWTFIEKSPKYAGKTAVLITTDHGRGSRNWSAHNIINPGSDEIWMAIAAPGLEAWGEVKKAGTIRQAQIAQTMAYLLGLNFTCDSHPVAPAIHELFYNPIPEPAIPYPVLSNTDIIGPIKK